MPSLQLSITFDPALEKLVNGHVENEFYEFEAGDRITSLVQYVRDGYKDDLPEETKYNVYTKDDDGQEKKVNRLSSLKAGHLLRIHCGIDETPVSQMMVSCSTMPPKETIQSSPSALAEDAVIRKTEETMLTQGDELYATKVEESLFSPAEEPPEETEDEAMIVGEPGASREISNVATSTPLQKKEGGRRWKRKMLAILRQNEDVLESSFRQMKPPVSLYVYGADIYHLLESSQFWRLTIAAANEPFIHRFASYELAVFNRFARLMACDVVDELATPSNGRSRVLKGVLDAFFTLTKNKFFKDLTTLKLARDVQYSRKKRASSGEIELIKRGKFTECAEGATNVDEVIQKLATDGGNWRYIKETTKIRVSELINNPEYSAEEKGPALFFEQFPCFKKNVLLMRHDFIEFMRCKHRKSPVVDLKSCLSSWGPAILKLAEMKGLNQFKEDDYDLRVLRSLFQLAIKHKLCTVSKPCDWTALVHDGKGHLDAHSLHLEVKHSFCIMMLRVKDYNSCGYKHYISLENDILQVPSATLFDALQMYYQLNYMFNMEFSRDVKCIMEFLEKLSCPSSAVFTSGQYNLHADLRRIAEEKGYGCVDTEHVYRVTTQSIWAEDTEDDTKATLNHIID